MIQAHNHFIMIIMYLYIIVILHQVKQVRIVYYGIIILLLQAMAQQQQWLNYQKQLVQMHGGKVY